MNAQHHAHPPAAVDNDTVPHLQPTYQFRWEAPEQAYLLLYPEGIVKLNRSAGEILRRCDGTATVAAIVADLEQAFETTGLREDVHRFLEMSHAKGWIRFEA